jgi:Cu-Zn family superoxide dismutase
MRLIRLAALGLVPVLLVGCDARDEEMPADNTVTEGAATTDAGMTPPAPVTAQAMVQPLGGSNVNGQATFTEAAGGGVDVSIQLTGLPPGDHGIHVHENGDCGDMGKAAGAHWNPHGAKHGVLGGAMGAAGTGAPASAHMGDLGNITADASGSATLTMRIPDWTVGTAMGGTATGTAPSGMEMGATTNTMGATTNTMTGSTTGSMGGMDMSVVGKTVVVHAKADDLKTDPSGNSGDRIACGVINESGSAATVGASPALPKK